MVAWTSKQKSDRMSLIMNISCYEVNTNNSMDSLDSHQMGSNLSDQGPVCSLLLCKVQLEKVTGTAITSYDAVINFDVQFLAGK